MIPIYRLFKIHMMWILYKVVRVIIEKLVRTFSLGVNCLMSNFISLNPKLKNVNSLHHFRGETSCGSRDKKRFRTFKVSFNDDFKDPNFIISSSIVMLADP